MSLDLDVIQQRAEAAHQEVVRLCEGGRFTMRIPADDRDSDLLLDAPNEDVLALIAELRDARARLAAVEALHCPRQVDAITGDCATEECDHEDALDAATEAVEAEFTSINAGSDHGARDVAEAAVYAFLGARGLLATARTRPTRISASQHICSTIHPTYYGTCSQCVRAADAVLALLADQPETTTEWGVRAKDRWDERVYPAADEQAARADRRAVNLVVVRREVTAWTEAD